ncbi:MAG TPA: hypothetical protein GX717_03145 [Clostridiaceae bacterium]|nr:hypothetical protein [Clostridiaceae bacterium]
MHAATKTKNQIIIYIIADRYTDSQQTTFFTDAQNIANHLINSFPISEYKEWVQIYAIGTISTSSSISIIAGGAGTASGDITRDNVRPFVQYHFPSVTNPSIANNHSWLVMQNGRGGGYAYPEGYSEAGVAVTSTAVGTALHEQGHLWGLWDEYDTSTYYSVYNDGPNTRRNVNLSNPKTGTNAIPSQWGLFIGETAGTNNRWEGIDNVGLYPMSTAGWGSTIWYRPNSQCTMNVSSGNPYCQVCAEHIFRRFSSGRELYTVIVSGSNTTITGLTATGKSVSNDLTIPVVHSDGIVKTIGNGSSSGFSGSSTTNFFLRMEVKYLLLQRAHFLMQLKCPKLQSLQVSQILLQMPLKTVLV